MKMGRERAVLRWDIHASLLQERIARTEQALSSLGAPANQRTRERAAELADLRRQLAALGPTPRAKMG
ncbi:MAG TPA: hypothetical protein VKQ30_23895 [Ktedonobacterales bacterium]|nr:hypothetical protein [Ktedonobacterales bacterium]